ncbi:hypothetical protein AAVH_23283 [Aphelenchoides avenae]|nr:hypothetical protein AAVH_23283 [Aphelenchus avenae]
MAAEALIKSMCRRLAQKGYHAETDLSFFEQGRLDGFIFDFGQQRLGGVFLSFDKASKTIAIDYPFIRCDAKRSNFLMRLLAHFIRAKGHYPRFKRIKRVIPSFLAKYFEPLLVSTNVEREEDVGGALGFPPGVLIQYTWQISELLKLLA